MELSQWVTTFIDLGIVRGMIDPLDRTYFTNQLIELLKYPSFKKATSKPNVTSFSQCVEPMVAWAVQHGKIPDRSSARDILQAQIMNVLVPLPSVVNHSFWEKYDKESPESATDYFYDLSCQSKYIKTEALAKNIAFKAPSPYGELELTINLSKPEKDPRDIAAQSKQPANDYPANVLSADNEGYAGSVEQAPRTNHRLIRFDVLGEEWALQYSPYGYYKEHAIFLATENRPMTVDLKAVERLLELVTLFPHYFVGSNAGLPIVGGSILSQDHYQGGRYHFPIEEAEVIDTFAWPSLPQVKASVLKWPLAVIRLESQNKAQLLEAAEKVINFWADYSDPSVQIMSKTNGERHNAFTPIARRKGTIYELDIVLRNNRTTTEFPDGVFHPHPPVQHIKRENIGLIEVMGLAILPPRLKDELSAVKKFWLNETDQIEEKHRSWAERVKQVEQPTADQVDRVMERALTDVFVQVLEDAGVFKTNAVGRQAFSKFVTQLQAE